ncbi:GNAT family N-acetyltransferase [Flavobacteriaceae bacterium]|nr:GNAT family N-acetyltransferase [Flavobacteriaceae bacterium]
MPLANYTIREAVQDDLEILQEFEQGVIQYERPFAPKLKEDPIVYYDIQNLIERDDTQVLVVVIDNKLVGSGYALIKESAPYKNPSHFAYLGFMYVVPEHRGKGLNGGLIKELVQWAKDRDIHEVQLDVYAENQSAIKAYTKLGFKPDLLKMRL